MRARPVGSLSLLYRCFPVCFLLCPYLEYVNTVMMRYGSINVMLSDQISVN